MFYKHNWNILNKSQVYSLPKMFFLSLATFDYGQGESPLPYLCRAAAPEGTGGDGVLAIIFLNYTEVLQEVLRFGERPG